MFLWPSMDPLLHTPAQACTRVAHAVCARFWSLLARIYIKTWLLSTYIVKSCAQRKPVPWVHMGSIIIAESE